MDAMPITTLDTRPSAPPFRPFVPGAVPGSDVWWWVLMAASGLVNSAARMLER